jgi:hypothetical protein
MMSGVGVGVGSGLRLNTMTYSLNGVIRTRREMPAELVELMSKQGLASAQGETMVG